MATESPLEPFAAAPPRILVRALGVVGVLLLIGGWRLDQAVRTAYASDWTSRGGRLPGGWIYIHLGAAVGGFAALLVAVLMWQARDDVGPPGEPGQLTLRQLAWAAAAVAAIAAAAGGVFRGLADADGGATKLKYAVICDVVALVALGAIVLFVGVRGPVPILGRLRRFIQRHRVNLIGVLGLALVLTLVPQTSGQAIDSVRTWVVWTPHAMDRAAFGLATTVLLALVVYESGARLAQFAVGTLIPLRTGWWLGVGAAMAVCGLVLWRLVDVTGAGLVVCGCLLFLMGVFDLTRLEAPLPPTPPPAESSGPPAPKVQKSAPPEPISAATPEYLAIVPLLAITAITIAAAIDAALSDKQVSAGSVAVLAPGLILAGVAVLMTRRGNLPVLRRLPRSWGGWTGSIVGVVTFTGLLMAAHEWIPSHDETIAAALGFVALVLAVAYAAVLFHAKAEAISRNDSALVALPVAIVAGFCVFFGIHWDVHAVGSLLGVFGVVNLSLAFILAEFHYVVGWSLKRQAPNLLHALGMQQFPFVSLILVAWVLTGVLGAPKELHDARVLTPRATVGGAATYPARPGLRAAFASWVKAQPELRSASRDRTPLPLVVIASHGGGIRAAYWTALALDCIVGVSSKGVDGAALVPEDGHTCDTTRRDASAQRRAARRIFMVSGVSGGAVGLYAYAEQLLGSNGSLGDDRSWVPHRLGGDFAADTMAWGLFHDIPNHFVGFHSKPGGICMLHGLNDQCWTQDRAVVLEQSFDRRNAPGRADTGVRYVWDLRGSTDRALQQTARSVPLLVMNSTVTGGNTRAITSAADLADWPRQERAQLQGRRDLDVHPLAGTAEVSDALCRGKDIRLSTAALLAARFPYVSPSGRLEGGCLLSKAKARISEAPCAKPGPPGCEMRLVDGGYADNSGLFTLELAVPQLRRLAREQNAMNPTTRPIAVVLVEIDNHYRARLNEPPSAKGAGGQSLIPLLTAFGSHSVIETFARADAYRVTPRGCTITIAPGLHPGLLAPLGWELSQGAQDDLRNGLVRRRPTASEEPALAVAHLRLLQQWLGDDPDLGLNLLPHPLGAALATCVARPFERGTASKSG